MNQEEYPHVDQYDSFAREFRDADESFPDVTRPDIYELIDGSRQPKRKLLDLGCGYGRDLAYFNEKGFETCGIDVSGLMLSLARERVPEDSLALGNFEDLPYESDTFDVVFSRYAIQHSPNTSAVFKEAHRVLRKDGELVFLVTHPMRNYFEKEHKDYWLQEDIPSEILDGKLIVHEPSHTLTEYLSLFLLCNFTLEAFVEKPDPAAKRFEQFGMYPRVLILKYKKK